MIDVSIAVTEKTNPLAAEYVEFNPDTLSFTGDFGVPLDGQRLLDSLTEDERVPGIGQGSDATVRRVALYKSLLSSKEVRQGFLDKLYREQTSGSTRPSGALEGAFYSGRQPGTRNPTTVAALQQAIQELVGTGRGRAPAKRLRPS